MFVLILAVIGEAPFDGSIVLSFTNFAGYLLGDARGVKFDFRSTDEICVFRAGLSGDASKLDETGIEAEKWSG